MTSSNTRGPSGGRGDNGGRSGRQAGGRPGGRSGAPSGSRGADAGRGGGSRGSGQGSGQGSGKGPGQTRGEGPAGKRFGGKGGGGPRRSGPPGFAARQLSADLVAGVGAGRLLDTMLDGGELARRFEALETKDRALVRAITGTALRRHGTIAAVLDRLIERPLPEAAAGLRAILTVGAAQILFMEVPDHAAVSLAVEAVDRAPGLAPWKGLANGVLRRIARERDEVLAGLDAVALDTPPWLLARWSAAYGAETARAIAAMHAVEPSLDLAVKEDAEGWAARLGGIVLPTGGVRLVAHGPVERLDGYEEGGWWVQDAAAALPVRLLGPVAGLRVADLCAAPGGKTAALAAAGAKVTAVDASARRLDRLKSNLVRLGLAADVVAADVTGWMGAPFDAVLLDAPCSATGTIRRHPDAALLKAEGDIAGLAAIQRRLLDQAIRLVRPGGVLVYSTCSLEPEEGPDQIRRLFQIGAPVERVPVTAEEIGGDAAMVTADGDLRTLPCQLPHADPRLSGLDGFFAARLRRL